MANSVTETLLGAAVLAAAAGFIAYASQTAGFGGAGAGRYELQANFISAEGVSVGTDVRMAGVKIGSVTSMGLNPDTYQAHVTVSLRDDIKVPEDSDIKVATEGILGGNYLELTPGGSEYMLESGDEILMTQSAVSFLNLMLKFATGSGQDTGSGPGAGAAAADGGAQ